jgi:hypothetical protein
MATQKSTVLINVNSNIPFITPDVMYQLQQSISSKYDVTAVVIPNPIISKPVEITSNDEDQNTVNTIEADASATLLQLVESTQQTNQ